MAALRKTELSGLRRVKTVQPTMRLTITSFSVSYSCQVVSVAGLISYENHNDHTGLGS